MIFLDDCIFIVEVKDKREQFLIELLRESGYKVCTFLNRVEDTNLMHIYVFSITTTLDYSDLARLSQGSIVFLNCLNDACKNYAKLANLTCIEYLKDETFLINNAQLTAEGTLALILQNTPKSLKEISILIMGYGRVGKACALLFHNNHIKFAITNRNIEHKCDTLFLTETTYDISQFTYYLDEYDVIINTIPSLILNAESIKNIRHGSLVIDLASKPGGVDFGSANEAGIKTIHALGLPGKFSPKSAAEQLKKAIINNTESKLNK
ncbi:MAG: hypothetical protein LBF68_06375 [Christensenellaceae bacterium]|jgi:dipicolinate synthase subunit A|nr:hypothetical protein [Christensenellaceae bacterium]